MRRAESCPHDNDSLSLRGMLSLTSSNLTTTICPLRLGIPTTSGKLKHLSLNTYDNDQDFWVRDPWYGVRRLTWQSHWRHLRRFQMWDFQRLWQGMGQMQCTWSCFKSNSFFFFSLLFFLKEYRLWLFICLRGAFNRLRSCWVWNDIYSRTRKWYRKLITSRRINCNYESSKRYPWCAIPSLPVDDGSKLPLDMGQPKLYNLQSTSQRIGLEFSSFTWYIYIFFFKKNHCNSRFVQQLKKSQNVWSGKTLKHFLRIWARPGTIWWGIPSYAGRFPKKIIGIL